MKKSQGTDQKAYLGSPYRLDLETEKTDEFKMVEEIDLETVEPGTVMEIRTINNGIYVFMVIDKTYYKRFPPNKKTLVKVRVLRYEPPQNDSAQKLDIDEGQNILIESIPFNGSESLSPQNLQSFLYWNTDEFLEAIKNEDPTLVNCWVERIKALRILLPPPPTIHQDFNEAVQATRDRFLGTF